MCITSLSTLLQGIVAVPSVFDVTIHGLKTDSREVASGDAFIALAGARTPADFYVDKAIAAGATVVLLETERAGECGERHGALVVPVPDLRSLVGRIADRFFEHPSQRLRLIGLPVCGAAAERNGDSLRHPRHFGIRHAWFASTSNSHHAGCGSG